MAADSFDWGPLGFLEGTLLGCQINSTKRGERGICHTPCRWFECWVAIQNGTLDLGVLFGTPLCSRFKEDLKDRQFGFHVETHLGSQNGMVDAFTKLPLESVRVKTRDCWDSSFRKLKGS